VGCFREEGKPGSPSGDLDFNLYTRENLAIMPKWQPMTDNRQKEPKNSPGKNVYLPVGEVRKQGKK